MVVEGGKVVVVVAHGAPQDAGMRGGHKPCHRCMSQRRVLRLALRVHLPRVRGQSYGCQTLTLTTTWLPRWHDLHGSWTEGCGHSSSMTSQVERRSRTIAACFAPSSAPLK